MPTTSYENALSLSHQGQPLVPVIRRLPQIKLTPPQALRKIRKDKAPCFLFESLDPHSPRSRYSFLGSDPEKSLCYQEKAVVESSRTGEKKLHNEPFQSVIRSFLTQHQVATTSEIPTFSSGLAGFFSYDYFTTVEDGLSFHGPDHLQLPEAHLFFFNPLVVFDHETDELFLLGLCQRENLEQDTLALCSHFDALEALLSEEPSKGRVPGVAGPFKAHLSKEDYMEAVHQAQNHIKEGDAFQIVLSNRFEAPFSGDLFSTYEVLRTSNPSPYLFYLDTGDMQMAGASPETLIRCEKEHLSTFPLAGTRPRGKNPEDDMALEKELLADEKEKAEHNMLVDLGRNDLGKVAQIGSVSLLEYMTVHRYSHVMHLASTVTARLAKEKDALDALEAILPAGTLSGAPKKRACEIIDQLEQDRRGPYGGAVGYLDASGSMDTCIAIRFALVHAGKVHVRAGAGIVIDSDPEKEYDECLYKAGALFEALEKGGMA